MLSRSFIPNFHNWLHRTAFCFDVKNHKTVQLGFRHLHSCASSSCNPHNSSGTSHSALKVAKFHSSSVVIMSSSSSLCPLSQDLQISHSLTLQKVSGENTFAKLTEETGFSTRDRGNFRRTGAPCPSTVTTAQDESVWHEFHYLFCLSDSNSYHVNLSSLAETTLSISRGIIIYQVREKADT